MDPKSGYVDDVFSTYPHTTTFGAAGGVMRHANDGFRIAVPPQAIPTGTVSIAVAVADLSGALPATAPGDTFTKVGPFDKEPKNEHGYAITATPDLAFAQRVTVQLSAISVAGGRHTFEAQGAVDPSAWHDRTSLPWKDSVSFQAGVVTVTTSQLGRPATTGGKPMRHFVAGHKP